MGCLWSLGMQGRSPNLAAMVRLYSAKYRKKAREELKGFRKQRFHLAVARAGLAEHEGGRRFSHQRRLKQTTLEEAREVLLSVSGRLRRTKDFDQLHESIQHALDGIKGLGSLYFYDTALRIGANLRMLPERVYLHRGTRAGAKALGLEWRESSLDPECLPKELASLKPHEVEDFLCIFKDRLGNA